MPAVDNWLSFSWFYPSTFQQFTWEYRFFLMFRNIFKLKIRTEGHAGLKLCIYAALFSFAWKLGGTL